MKLQEVILAKDTDAQIREAIPYLLQWYDFNKRILPWRESPTAYHVWVSEIMLQQTRIEAVKGYYDRFLSEFPTIAALEAASEEKLLKVWEGLGYYNRVRNMQKAAGIIVKEYNGEMPADYEKLRNLPGIGDYTAGAIASIAFGLLYPAVDGNVMRVLSRFLSSEADIAKEKTKQAFRQLLLSNMPRESGAWNQALMELGEKICIPNGKPLCEQCPLLHLCRAFHEGKETLLPVKAEKKERRIEQREVLILLINGKILLHRRPQKGLLAGLWEYPGRLTEDTKKKESDKKRLARWAEFLQNAATDVQIKKQKSIKAKHVFSHVEWHMNGVCMELSVLGKEKEENVMRQLPALLGYGEYEKKDWALVSEEERESSFPMPSAFDGFQKEVKGCVSEQDMTYTD